MNPVCWDTSKSRFHSSLLPPLPQRFESWGCPALHRAWCVPEEVLPQSYTTGLHINLPLVGISLWNLHACFSSLWNLLADECVCVCVGSWACIRGGGRSNWVCECAGVCSGRAMLHCVLVQCGAVLSCGGVGKRSEHFTGRSGRMRKLQTDGPNGCAEGRGWRANSCYPSIWTSPQSAD